MKPSEFYKIMEQFVNEDKFWRSLQVGDIVYSRQFHAEWKNDYHKWRIDVVNIDEREIHAREISQVGIPFSAKLTEFITEESYIKLQILTP